MIHNSKSEKKIKTNSENKYSYIQITYFVSCYIHVNYNQYIHDLKKQQTNREV